VQGPAHAEQALHHLLLLLLCLALRPGALLQISMARFLGRDLALALLNMHQSTTEGWRGG